MVMDVEGAPIGERKSGVWDDVFQRRCTWWFQVHVQALAVSVNNLAEGELVVLFPIVGDEGCVLTICFCSVRFSREEPEPVLYILPLG